MSTQAEVSEHESPEAVVARILADGRTEDVNGIPRIGRGTRKRAHAVVDALRAAGWRILRETR